MCLDLVLERRQSFLFQIFVLVLKDDGECVFVCLLMWIQGRRGGVMLPQLS